MMAAQLGPPAAVAGPIGAEGATDQTSSDASQAEAGGDFMTLLLGTPAAQGPPDPQGQTPEPAAGPLMGELLSQIGADAVDLPAAPAPVASVAGQAAAEPARPAPAGAVPVLTDGTVRGTPGSGVMAAAASVATTPVATVPAAPTAAAPVPGAVPPAAPAPAGVPAPAAPATSAPTLAGPMAPMPDGAPAAPVAAGVVTMTLTRTDAAAPGAGVGAQAPTVRPGADPTPRTVGPDAPATAPAQAPAPPAGAHGPAASQVHSGAPAHAGAPTGAPGAVTNAAELAHELGARMRMAVREGGRELVVNLRPQELGHLTVRVSVVDGVLTAQIAADRPEAARLLAQSLPQLGQVLGDLGYAVDGLDVALGDDTRREAPGGLGKRPAHGGDSGDDSDPSVVTVPGPVRGDVAGGGPSTGLDILA